MGKGIGEGRKKRRKGNYDFVSSKASCSKAVTYFVVFESYV